MARNEYQMARIDKLSSMSETPDDLLITCGSFEERCLAVPNKLTSNVCDNLVLFRFTERNDKREQLIQKMEEIFRHKQVSKRYFQIEVDHAKTAMGVINLHHLCQKNKWTMKNLKITLDITTFTKSLLLELLFYLRTFLSLDKLRFVYTVPQKYAHPEEGPLSFGIKSLNVLSSFWGGWSPIKDDLLMVILGYEEMRAWSLINRFDANLNLLFTTSPGSLDEWSEHSAIYNERLISELPPVDSIPALDPIQTSEVLGKYVTDDFCSKYNVFISPMGTKPQIVGLFYYILVHPETPVNIITTTPIEHNIPYYSWGIGETYEFFLPPLGKKESKS